LHGGRRSTSILACGACRAAESGRQTSIITTEHDTRRQPLIQQLLQHRGVFGLPLLRYVLDQCLHRTLDQHAQHCVGISTARASHTDRLREDAGGIGPASRSTLGTTDEVIDGRV